MASNRLTFALEGDVKLGVFALAMQRFTALVQALSEEVGEGIAITWYIDELQAGSAEATILGEAPDMEAVERTVHAYATVGGALHDRTPIPYSPKVVQCARELSQLITDDITMVWLKTDHAEIPVETPLGVSAEESTRTYAIGTINGTVQTLQRKRRLEFVLYDDLLNRSVRCYPRAQQEEQMREAWGKHVAVTGTIGRDAIRGYPLEIRHIVEIRAIPDIDPESYHHARGAIDLQEETPESAIRKLRDAW